MTDEEKLLNFDRYSAPRQRIQGGGGTTIINEGSTTIIHTTPVPPPPPPPLPSEVTIGDYIAGETMGSPRAIMLDGGKAYLFDPSDEANYAKPIGASINAVVIGGVVSVVEAGTLNAPGSFVQDGVYYAGANGVLTTVLPTSGILLKIGIAKDANNLIVEMNDPVVLA